MRYEDIEEGMYIRVLNQKNDDAKIMSVVRKCIDGFGVEFIVLRFTTPFGQVYIRRDEIPFWRLELITEKIE